MVNSPINTLSDNELVEMVKAGNERSAFNEIVRRNKGRIAYTVYGLLGKCCDAEDIGQEVFIRFLRAIENYNGKYALSTYLTRIAVNLSLNELRRRKIRGLFSFDAMQEDGMEIPALPEADPLDEKRAIVQIALSKLSDKHRTIIVLRLIDEYSTEETAQILNIPTGTVLSRLARAQEKLREILKSYREKV
ncbi:MAG TPA: RNA polymerase sigma factor [Ignavibacteriales bacterium]|nr:RNA polymerase sigma factor [Ignavibacteriales bacterium]